MQHLTNTIYEKNGIKNGICDKNKKTIPEITRYKPQIVYGTVKVIIIDFLEIILRAEARHL